MKAFRNFSRIIIAPIFIFSGFVKAIDPLGSTYKFSDYFEAWGMDFMSPIALVLAVLLSTAELVIGLNLLLGVLMRISSWALLIFMSFFTLLTFIVALTNPVTDCGCFGDALILTNWQTFWKNVIFMLPTLVVFYGRKRFKPISSMAGEMGITVLFVIAGILLSVYTFRNLPVIDFRPYKAGTHIPSAMVLPEGAAVDEYKTILVYAKDGEEREFEPQDVPYQDTTWKWVETQNILISKGEEPEIHDFTISTNDGYDITDSVLHNPNYTFLVIAHNLSKAKEQGLEYVNELMVEAKNQGASVYGMTASTTDIVNEKDRQYQFNFNFHTTDEITLKTIIRSNPGLLLLKDGVIVNKWHYNNLPKKAELTDGILSAAISDHLSVKKATTIGFYLLLLVALMSVLVLMVRTED